MYWGIYPVKHIGMLRLFEVNRTACARKRSKQKWLFYYSCACIHLGGKVKNFTLQATYKFPYSLHVIIVMNYYKPSYAPIFVQ